MSIDDKLRGLEIEFLHGVPVHLPYEAVAQIKQLFADEGYVKPLVLEKEVFMEKGYVKITGSQEQQAALANMILGNSVMTGQEWYDRFIAELEKSVYVNRVTQDFTDAVLAARYASGLEEK
jgi:hypothetical protein